MFYVDMGHLKKINSFFVFFMFTVFGIPNIERRKEKRNIKHLLLYSRHFLLLSKSIFQNYDVHNIDYPTPNGQWVLSALVFEI